MTFVPRDYQVWAEKALWDYVHTKPGKNPLVVLPTGTGKSLIPAMFMWHMLSKYPSLRMMSITHVKELIEGNYKTLIKLWTAAPAGVYSAGLGRKDSYAQLTFGGIQTVVKVPGRFGKIDFIIIDEAHLLSNRDSSSYLKFINALKQVNPHLVVIGLTATPFRNGMGMLTDGTLFDEVCFDGSDGEAFIWFIEQGYLIKPVPKNPGFEVDEAEVHLQGGDYNNAEASAAFRDQDILERAVDTIIAQGTAQDRQAWLSFCQSIEDAELVADMFKYKGYPVEAVHSKRGDRDEVLKAFKEGGLRGITNKDVLTTGFDHPPIDLIGMLRLTRSPGLWVQMLGRGTRPVFVNGYYGSQIGHNGGPLLGMHDLETQAGRLASIAESPKQNCLVLDFAGNSRRLGTINYPNLPRKRRKGAGGGMTRECPQCGTHNHISVKACEECGYEFPPPKRLEAKAGKEQLVESRVLDLMQPPPEPVYEVVGVHRMLATHNEGRNGKKDTLRVDYHCGHNRYSTWVCFEHEEKSFPRCKAVEWWQMHGGGFEPCPTTVAEALEVFPELDKPKFLKVRTDLRYPEIQGYDFRGTRFELPPEAGGPPLQEPEPDPLAELEEQAQKAREHLASAMEGGYYEDDIPF